MFSQLGPLFKTTFRQAESNDTRQAIPHEERDQQRRRRQEEEKEEKTDIWEDNTSVTVEALRAFLINFLKTIPGIEDNPILNQENTDDALPTRPPESRRPTNTKNAKAVRAYQSMAEKSTTARPPPKPTSDKIEPTADLLESKELRDIYTLIDDLDVLARKGIQVLHIEKADSFIESLKQAVHSVKSKI